MIAPHGGYGSVTVADAVGFVQSGSERVLKKSKWYRTEQIKINHPLKAEAPPAGTAPYG